MSEPMIEGERLLSGPEKAAALLLMMGKPPAARLLKHFDPPDLRTSRARPRAWRRRADIARPPCRRIRGRLLGRRQSARRRRPGAQSARRGPPAQRGRRPSRLRARRGQGAGHLAGARASSGKRHHRLPDRRAAGDRDLPPLQARPVARGEDRQRAAARAPQRRAVRTGRAVPGDAPRRADSSRTRLREMLTKAKTPSGGSEGRLRIAGIINNLEPDEAEDVMRAIGKARPKDAAILKTMLFTFNDLPKLSERARALLFDRASIDIVVMALRGTDAEFRNAVLSSMPSRGAPAGRGRTRLRRLRAGARHRKGAQGHRRHRARHGEPQRDRTQRPARRRRGLSRALNERRRRSGRQDRGADGEAAPRRGRARTDRLFARGAAVRLAVGGAWRRLSSSSRDAPPRCSPGSSALSTIPPAGGSRAAKTCSLCPARSPERRPSSSGRSWRC